MKCVFPVSLIALAAAGAVQAENNNSNNASMEHMVIIGSQEEAKTLPGSAFVVNSEELQKFEYTDIHRILRQVPGVYIQQEDGYGLRPNIGIRGAGGHRSEKITLMEDGVLIAPAPYSGPSAYYFPTTARMSSVEVLKGPESIKYGPYTVGGAVNLVSTPIPVDAKGYLQVEVGQYGEDRIHAWYGDSSETFGWLFETSQHNADGFKEIDRSSRDAGLDKEDYMAKLRFSSDAAAEYYNQFDIKLQYSTEISNQSYLGLTDVDFDDDPNRRYGMSELDQMDNEHASVNLSHFIALSSDAALKTTVYYNDFERDWYKLSGGSAYIKAANGVDVTTQAAQDAQDFLDGTVDETGLGITHNARQYEAYGLQSELSWIVDLAGMKHDLDIGLRWHEDEVDRYQPKDIFEQSNGRLAYISTDNPGPSSNRIEEAEALAVYVMDHIAVTDKLDMTFGFRYEDIETEQTRYSDEKARKLAVSTKSNSVDDILPAIGATYRIDDQWSILGGIHKGFAPADAGAEDQDPEESINYEAGARFSKASFFGEAIAFFSDYKNSVQYCTVANSCSNDVISGSESNGEAEIKGLELLVSYDFSANQNYSIPASFTYTYTDTEITENSDDGGKLKGDILADIPENQWAASIGYLADSGWNTYLNASYIDDTCIDHTCDRSGVDDNFMKTDDLLVFDFSTNYPLNKQARIYAKVDNLFDEQQIVSRKPDGARANKPRTAYVGLKVSF